MKPLPCIGTVGSVGIVPPSPHMENAMFLIHPIKVPLVAKTACLETRISKIKCEVVDRLYRISPSAVGRMTGTGDRHCTFPFASVLIKYA